MRSSTRCSSCLLTGCHADDVTTHDAIITTTTTTTTAAAAAAAAGIATSLPPSPARMQHPLGLFLSSPFSSRLTTISPSFYLPPPPPPPLPGSPPCRCRHRCRRCLPPPHRPPPPPSPLTSAGIIDKCVAQSHRTIASHNRIARRVTNLIRNHGASSFLRRIRAVAG